MTAVSYRYDTNINTICENKIAKGQIELGYALYFGVKINARSSAKYFLSMMLK